MKKHKDNHDMRLDVFKMLIWIFYNKKIQITEPNKLLFYFKFKYKSENNFYQKQPIVLNSFEYINLHYYMLMIISIILLVWRNFINLIYIYFVDGLTVQGRQDCGLNINWPFNRFQEKEIY